MKKLPKYIRIVSPEGNVGTAMQLSDPKTGEYYRVSGAWAMCFELVNGELLAIPSKAPTLYLENFTAVKITKELYESLDQKLSCLHTPK